MIGRKDHICKHYKHHIFGLGAMGDFLNPYNGFLIFDTMEESSVYPLGCSMYIYSSNLPRRKALLSLLSEGRDT